MHELVLYPSSLDRMHSWLWVLSLRCHRRQVTSVVCVFVLRCKEYSPNKDETSSVCNQRRTPSLNLGQQSQLLWFSQAVWSEPEPIWRMGALPLWSSPIGYQSLQLKLFSLFVHKKPKELVLDAKSIDSTFACQNRWRSDLQRFAFIKLLWCLVTPERVLFQKAFGKTLGRKCFLYVGDTVEERDSFALRTNPYDGVAGSLKQRL